MKNQPLYLVAFLLIGIFSSSCKNEKVVLIEPSQGLIDSISLFAMTEFGDSIQPNIISKPSARGLQWKAWEAWFKNCPANTTFKNNIVYLGAASSKNVGYIMSKDKSINKWDFFKLNNDPNVYKTFIDKGVDVTQCDLSEMKDFSFDMVADGNFLTSVNAELQAFVAKSDSISIKAGTWRIESIESALFMDYLNSTNDPTIKKYRESLLDKKNVVLTKVLKISGFQAEIISKDTITAGLTATLANGFNVNVVPTDTSKQIGFDLKFNKTSSKKVTVSSTGVLSLFGQASKGVKLK